MSEPFIGEIRMFAGNYAPVRWAFCQGQFLPIRGNEALFDLLGNQYGGHGKTTFSLPNLCSRVPINQGHGEGLTNRTLADKGGEETVILTTENLPSHTHQMRGSTGAANSTTAVGSLAVTQDGNNIYADPPANVSMAAAGIREAGDGAAHYNMQPYLAVNFIIALTGIYPSSRKSIGDDNDSRTVYCRNTNFCGRICPNWLGDL